MANASPRIKPGRPSQGGSDRAGFVSWLWWWFERLFSCSALASLVACSERRLLACYKLDTLFVFLLRQPGELGGLFLLVGQGLFNPPKTLLPNLFAGHQGFVCGWRREPHS